MERAPRKRSEIAGRKSRSEEEGLSGETSSCCCRLRRSKSPGRAGLSRTNRGELPGHRRSPGEPRSDARPECRGETRLSPFPLSRRRSGPRSGKGLTRTLLCQRGTLSPLKAAAILPFSWIGIPTHSRFSPARRKAGAGRLPSPASLLALGRGDQLSHSAAHLLQIPLSHPATGMVRKCKCLTRPVRKGLACRAIYCITKKI